MVNPPISRREFLGATAAAAGAGLLLTSCRPDDTPQPSSKKTPLDTLNVALIGFGEEGHVLLESLLNIEGVRVVALCDI